MNDMHALPHGDWVALLPLTALLPHEEHDAERAGLLSAEIQAQGVWTEPLLIERRHFIILDGHHRWEAAKRLNLATVPARMIAYGDPRLSLTSWRPGERWTPRDVIARALTGNLCPIKTTRHTLRAVSAALPFGLAELRRAL
ncbi:MULTISPECIES: ParB N-terminal domain-containing protein [Rhodomicrobium]|uniref:ParB N-terminal domain-containing protein n=1 Tax=Rhodomicrobium TaxID=1068 RepID=UPI0014832409|nr:MULTISPECIES: ParB N-terminal domain-containing protein [Rhodomicrobium]